MSKYLPTWMTIGHSISASTVEAALDAADLNYTVEKSPLQAVTPGQMVRDKVATFRTDRNEVIGVVGPDYGIVNNIDGFGFADLIPNLTWVRGGETYTGLNFLVGQLPDADINGEKYGVYVVFQNSFNYRSHLKGQVILVDSYGRCVTMPGKADIKIRHSKRAESRVKQAKAAMATVNDYIESFTMEAGELGKHLVDEAALEVVVSDLFPIKKGASDKAINNANTKREEFMRSYRDGANANWHGTAWGLIKAFADFTSKVGITRGRKSSKKAQRVFENTLVGGKAYKRLMTIINNL